MNKLYSQSFVVLTFATVNDIYDKVKKCSVQLQRNAIVEVAAVKIKCGEIDGHYHSFIAIDGYDARNIEFGDLNFNSYNLSATHLIGAPEFKKVIEKLNDFFGDSTLLVQSVSSDKNNPFEIFKKQAEECGYSFSNTAISLSHLYTAVRLQNALDERCMRFEEFSGVGIAQLLAEDDDENWTDVFDDYDVPFNPSGESVDGDRNDPLSWALAFAKLFVKLVDVDEVIDDEYGYDDEYASVDDKWLPF